MCTIHVFVDGFNFYYGMFRGKYVVCPPSHKWVNPVGLAEQLCSVHQIPGRVERVTYCTAPARAGVDDPDQPTRQQHYFRALQGLGNVTILQGIHKERIKKVMDVDQLTLVPTGTIRKAAVREEKGSDVNLAVALVRGAALNEYDTALLITNDSDLEAAVTCAIHDFGKEVVVASPAIDKQPGQKRVRVVRELAVAASRCFVIDHTLLAHCQLPNPSLDIEGRPVYRPASWT